VATNVNLEAWWYPVWLNQLEVYTEGYANAGLSIAPQASLVYQFLGNPTNVAPDFMVIESQAGGSRELKLVMENKRDPTDNALADAMADAVFYKDRAVNQTNSPVQMGFDRIVLVATAGRFWRWREYTRPGVGSAWTSPNGWSARLDTGTSFSPTIQL
jgi:hypothetical protein